MRFDENLYREGIAWLKGQGVDYGDIRAGESQHELLEVRNEQPERIARSSDRGFGVRVLHGGGWGFAASCEETPEAVRRTASRAIEIARASALTVREKARLAPERSCRDRWASPCIRDPFEVPMDLKLDLLLRASSLLRKDPRIAQASASLQFFRTEKGFWSTEGAEILQTVLESGGGIETVALAGGEVQKRSYPSSFGGDFRQAGWEFIEALDLPGNAERTREEALALLQAEECPAGERDLLVTSSQLALQVHESCGHPAELDRVLGTELSFAGGSFLSTEKRGKYRYGSPRVSITADSTLPGGLGTFGYDDEGVRACRTPLVSEGIFRNYLTSRETAVLFGDHSNGCMRAQGWNHIPLIRMVNVSLEPDPDGPSLEDLVASTDEGILVETNRSWSIDDLRLNFQFGCEMAWEIRNGKRVRLLRNPVYTGSTPVFWGSCDAVCGPSEWRLWGLLNCGKGEPTQVMHVAHGTSPARFRGVQVGVKR